MSSVVPPVSVRMIRISRPEFVFGRAPLCLKRNA